MHATSFIAALTFLASSAFAASHYSPNPAIIPHHLALISSPRKYDALPTPTSPELSCTTPAPWPFKCGLPGNLTTPEDTISFTFTDTFDECRDLCVNNSTCSAFGYQDGYNTCTTVMKSLRANGFAEDDVDSNIPVWYNRKCFSCTLVSNDTNFVTNGDFGTGTLQYWDVGAPAVVPNADNGTDTGISSPGDLAPFAFYADLPTSHNLVFLSQVLDTIANSTYNITFNYMVENADVKQAIYFLAGDDDQDGSSEFYIPPAAFVAGEWNGAQGSYVAQENSTIGFVFAASGNQTFYVDNVVVIEIIE